jgi:hypothetical protein
MTWDAVGCLGFYFAPFDVLEEALSLTRVVLGSEWCFFFWAL